LGSLGLELVENTGQFGDLVLVEVESLSEKTQWPAHAETGAKIVVHFFTWSFPGTAVAVTGPGLAIETDGHCTRRAMAGGETGMHDGSPGSRGPTLPRGILRGQHAAR